MPIWPTKGWANGPVITPYSLESLGWYLGAIAQGTSGAGAATITQNKSVYVPFLIVDRAWTAKRMFVYNGSTINGNIDMGILDSQGNSIVTKGSTLHAGASALQFLDITDTTLQPGLYYMAFASDSATATFFLRAPNVVHQRPMFIREQLSTYPITTTTATFAVPTTTMIPIFGVSSRTF